MAGRRRQQGIVGGALILSVLSLWAGAAFGQVREASEPAGTVTFEPPRRATIRHKAGQIIRGELMGISREAVHFRVSSGKEVEYDLKTIRSIATSDGEFKYASAYDTYRELVERARGLTGVTIDAAAAVAGTGKPAPLPQPPPPPLPTMFDSPEKYALDAEPPKKADPPRRSRVPAAAPAPNPVVAGSGQPFYETGAFKLGFLVACLAVVLLWWRNRVG